jgi:hypothetical protein
MLGTILLAFAFVFGCFAAAGWEKLGRVHTGWLALTLLVGAMLFGALLPFFR